MMTCINVVEFVLISLLEKDHSMIETRRLKNVVIFIQTIFYFNLSLLIIYPLLDSVLPFLLLLAHIITFSKRNLRCLYNPTV